MNVVVFVTVWRAVGDGERDLVGAGLVVVRRPVEEAGVRVERGARRQQVAREGDGLAVRVVAVQVEAEVVALADRPVGRGDQHRRLVGRGDRERDLGGDLVDAVADVEGDVLVGAGRVEVGRPGEAQRGRVERGAGRQVVGPEGQRVAVGVDDRQRAA